MLLWLVAGFAALLALLAFGIARRVSRKLNKLNHSYWELQYQFGELKARLAQLDPERRKDPAGGSSSSAEAFVPLSSVKR